MVYLYIESPVSEEQQEAEEYAKRLFSKVKARLNCREYYLGKEHSDKYDVYKARKPVAVFKIKMGTMTWREIFKEFMGAGGEIIGYWEVDGD